jgi:trk system potassium uptake protein TrkH
MRKRAVFRLNIIFLGFFSLTMLVPFTMALILGEREMVFSFGVTMAAALAAAIPVFCVSRGPRFNLNFSATEGILLVCAIWITGSLLGAVPYYLSGYMPRFSDAVFESVSGFTTTGATVIPDVEILPRSFHLWRGMTHWLGGMGIVVLTVALVPMLGVGGFMLLKAETSGPMKDKFTPRVTSTAKILWLVYCGITALQVILLAAGGMGLFDAVIHSFSTMATGGFSTRNNSIAAYHSPYIEWVCTVFMLIAGLNFTLTYRLLQGRFREAFANTEARAYILILVIATGMVVVSIAPESASFGQALRHGMFQVASIYTTTGLMAANHSLWPPLAQLALFCLMFIGGCSGSTAGGVKVIRHVILFKQMKNELHRLLYPSGLFSIQLDNKPGRKDVVYSVAGYFCIYGLLLFAGMVLLTSAGFDIYNGINAVLLILGGIGLGLGDLTSGALFYNAPDYVRWGLSLLMIIGRLELFTVVVLFVPSFWKR